MERKTMGSFIAVLRKSSGMTQKQLAEKLNVSDKTISHWERDESAPDLSVIPAIAEIFNVTCDELLRGEKLQDSTVKDENITQKGEKQIKYLLEKNLNTLKVRGAVSAGLTVIGFVSGLAVFSALIDRDGMAAFFTATAFYAVSIICAVVFRMIFSYKSGNMESELSKEYSLKANSVTAKSIYFNIVIFALSLPIAIFSGCYSLKDLLEFIFMPGLLYAGIALGACIIVDLLFKSAGIIYKKKKTKKERKISRLRACVIIVTALVIVVAAVFQHNQDGPFGDMLGMIAYGFYPIVVIAGFGVYAFGVKRINKMK